MRIFLSLLDEFTQLLIFKMNQATEKLKETAKK
jgi:hypothetical protein